VLFACYFRQAGRSAPACRSRIWFTFSERACGGDHCAVQFAINSLKAGCRPASSTTPRILVWPSWTRIKRLFRACHDTFTRLAASFGNRTAVPGGATVASNWVSFPGSPNATLGRARRENGRRRTMTASARPLPQRSMRPARSKSDLEV
jgi:hypothetical protein